MHIYIYIYIQSFGNNFNGNSLFKLALKTSFYFVFKSKIEQKTFELCRERPLKAILSK